MATLSCFVDLIDVTLACEDANSKLVADDDRVGNNFVVVADLKLEVSSKS